MRTKKKGLAFSLDALGGIMIAMILIGIVAFTGSNFMTNAKNERAISESASLGALVSEFRQEVGRYPKNLDEMKNKSGQYGPWLKKIPEDPWYPGHNYGYKYDANGFAVYSVGKNKSDSSSATKIGSGNIGFVGK